MELLNNVYQFVCCIRKPVFPDPYQFQFHATDPPMRNSVQFQSNFVKTSKYTWYDFFFKALFLQFQRLANVYFLIIAVLQTISIISPLSPLTAWAPLCVVLAISILRQGYEDYQRYKSDKQMNYESKTQVFREGKFVQVEWSKIKTGDICKIYQQQLFPADLILLSSTTEGGVAFIQTASLDGQKNLKPRSSYKLTNSFQSQQLLNSFKGEWKGILPNKQLHKFSSKMLLNGQTIVFEGDKQLLYRGARLKNTKHIYGLAIYTGKNTKIMLNSQSSSVKMSQIEVKVNKILGIILVIQIVLSFIAAILYGFFRNAHSQDYTYIDWSSFSTPVDSILIFFSYFVLINTMIPISLIVSIQIVKISQSYFINCDFLMFSQFRNKFVNVKSASLNQQLGQIQYIFSDKTGTLTMNLMEFKIAVIGDKMFGDLGLIIKDPLRPPQTQKGFKDEKLAQLLQNGQGNHNIQLSVRNKQGSQAISFSSLKDLAEQYFNILSIAHQCVSDVDKAGKPIYQGPSPDQISLVDAAKQMGFQFVKSTQESTVIKVKGVQRTYQLLDIFSFTSDRKRMSAIIKSNGVIKMYTKGADSIIKQRLSSQSTLNLDSQLTRFSSIGLRTLLIAMRTISDSQYQTFKKKVEQLPAQNKQKHLNELISELQSNLYLIGATAVLDRLQDQVPETIRDLIRANIKIWMLTGDKMETAQNIAKSCRLIQDSFQIIRYECKDQTNILSYLKELVAKVQKLAKSGTPKALLIQGHDLTPILANDQNQTQLANLAQHCQSVVCCRLLPIQKAEVVSVVRRKLNKITLSIGDGANDVPMIKTAHIGIGLFGEEGMGAVQASDYALPEFKMLWRLLLVHGRWNYIRISEMVLYFFYKNMLFTIPQYIFAFYCGYSGQTIFDDVYISLYNLLFTSIPLVVRAVLQQDINYVVKKSAFKQSPLEQQNSSVQQLIRGKKNAEIQKQNKYLPKGLEVNKNLFRLFPKIYFIGQENAVFNYTNYTLWLIQGVIQAIMISLCCMYVMGNASMNQKGYNSDMWIVSVTTFSSVVLVVTFKLATHTRFWSVILFLAVAFLSLAFYVSYMWLSNYHLSDYVQGTAYMAWTTAQPYFMVLFCTCVVLFLDGIILSIDFDRGGYISRMRQVINQEREDHHSAYSQSLKITQGLTVNND